MGLLAPFHHECCVRASPAHQLDARHGRSAATIPCSPQSSRSSGSLMGKGWIPDTFPQDTESVTTFFSFYPDSKKPKCCFRKGSPLGTDDRAPRIR